MSIITDTDGAGAPLVELCPITASMVRDYVREALEAHPEWPDEDPLMVLDYVTTKLYCLDDDNPTETELQLVAHEVDLLVKEGV